MRHVLVILGKLSGHGKNRKPLPEYIGPMPEEAATNLYQWFLERYKGLPSFSELFGNGDK